jgi:RNA polymerase sigma-70 factor (ECF subfamily)
VTASDGDIVSAAQHGDKDAFGTLVRQYQGRLFALVLMMVRNRAAAEEIAQDTFVRAYTHLGQFDARRPFYPWLATIAVRLSQNWLRHYGRTDRRESTPIDEEAALAAGDDALQALLSDERGRQLWRAVSSLPSGERTVVMLYYRDDMPVRDIARALGVTTGTIKTLLFRARRHLREQLSAARLADERTRA